MWLYILMAAAGAIGLAAGIVRARKTGDRRWHILTAAGAVLAAAGIILAAAVFLLLGGIASDVPEAESTDGQTVVGGDWRTWRGYSADYVITDELTVCLSELDNGSGYGVYDCADGGRIASLLAPDGTEGFFDRDVVSADRDGDGSNDLGVELADGSVLWYCFDAEGLGTWPDDTDGCFKPAQ